MPRFYAFFLLAFYGVSIGITDICLLVPLIVLISKYPSLRLICFSRNEPWKKNKGILELIVNLVWMSKWRLTISPIAY
jgi:hypothetical protein